ncbi:hypothetical protein D3C78_1905860 [compost metagenome]
MYPLLLFPSIAPIEPNKISTITVCMTAKIAYPDIVAITDSMRGILTTAAKNNMNITINIKGAILLISSSFLNK